MFAWFRNTGRIRRGVGGEREGGKKGGRDKEIGASGGGGELEAARRDAAETKRSDYRIKKPSQYLLSGAQVRTY